jgi:hypothetical protein
MEMVSRTAAVLQGLLTTEAEDVGRQCGLIQRQREFTASSLVATFVLGFLRHPQPRWDQLAWVARERGANVTPQAVEQRVTPALRDTLRGVWQKAIAEVVMSEDRVQPLLQRFTRVLIGDSTTIALSDALADEFPGCGGSHGFGRASAKWQVIWDCLSGSLWKMSWEAGRQNDSTSSILDETPPSGSLSIFDLGYFSLERFRRWQNAGAHWISRGISDLLVTVEGQTHDLHEWLDAQPPGVIDRWVEVGASRLRCRVIALRAPEEVAARRRQKARDKAAKKGRQPTARHLATCAWTVFLTSCPEELLSWNEVVVLYRVRWQIELLFKLWKSHNLLDEHRSDDPVRQLVELYARMTAVLIQHWLLLTTVWSDPRVSLTKATRLIRDELSQLIPIVTQLPELIDLLTRWRTQLPGLARIDQRKNKPNNPQLLANPTRLTFNY